MAKRGNSEGSLYRRLDGRWTAAYVGTDGKRRYMYGKTRQEAAKKLREALHAKDRGLPTTQGRGTVGAFLQEWLEISAKPKLRPLTYIRYEGIVRNHLLPTIGRIHLTKLYPEAVQSLYKSKIDIGLSGRSVEHIHAVLRRALAQALKWDRVARNVALLVDAPRPSHHEIRPFTPTEARAFLQAVRGERFEALFSTVLAVGLRMGEALGLRWVDINVDSGTLSVNAALQRLNGKLQLVETKSARSRRLIALPDSITAALRAHRIRQLEEALQLGYRNELGLVFVSPTGTPLDARNIRRKFRVILQKAGLPQQRFHDLRHACASLLLAQNIHPRVVMEVLGHSQISLTMNTYSHLIPSLGRDAAKSMDAVLTA